MYKIGLTGGIGSGKSTIARIFEVLGTPVFYADNAAKEILSTDPDLKVAVKDVFGNAVYTKSGGLDRKALARIVFNDQEALKTLNELVHPAVRQRFSTWVHEKASNDYVVQEAALLFETGANDNFDYMVSVTAPEEIRINRIQERDEMTRSDVLSRMAFQMPQAEKDHKADSKIMNDGRQFVIPQVLQIHKKFTSFEKALL